MAVPSFGAPTTIALRTQISIDEKPTRTSALRSIAVVELIGW